MGVAAIFGVLTCIAQGTVFIASLNPKDPDLEKLKAALSEAESNMQSAEREYQAGAEQIVARLKRELADAERERDDLKKQVTATVRRAEKMPGAKGLGCNDKASRCRNRLCKNGLAIRKGTGGSLGPFA